MLNALSTLALVISGGTLLTNMATFRTPRGTIPNPAPKVSILIPARNEELNIRPCVESLISQDYPNFELIVLDDHSDDETGSILNELRVRNGTNSTPQLTVLRGTSLPEGWAGKNWACHQLAQAADPASRYLLFTDADTIHRPHALRAAIARAERKNLTLLSLMPEQQVDTLAEQLIVPMFGLQILGYLPLLAMEHFPIPAFAAANGQYLLFRHEAYLQMEGHAAIAGEIAEDVSLARLAKGQGRIQLGNGAGLVSCRMYRTPADIMRGFRRSFSSGFRIDPIVSWAMVSLNFFAYFLPFLQMMRLSMTGGRYNPVPPGSVVKKRNRMKWMYPPSIVVTQRLIGAIFLLRSLLAWRTRTPAISVLGHPIGMAFLLYSQLRAALDARGGQSTPWKGRSYPLKKD